MADEIVDGHKDGVFYGTSLHDIPANRTLDFADYLMVYDEYMAGRLKGDTGLTGPQGLQGTQGVQGIRGIQGVPGEVGPVGPAGLTWKGQWNSLEAYTKDDAVGYNGASYFCLRDNTAALPTESAADWALLASQGARGPQGLQGAQGDQGAKGDIGPTGLQGIQGVQGLKGAKGDKGDKGDPGVTISLKRTALPGINASVDTLFPISTNIYFRVTGATASTLSFHIVNSTSSAFLMDYEMLWADSDNSFKRASGSSVSVPLGGNVKLSTFTFSCTVPRKFSFSFYLQGPNYFYNAEFIVPGRSGLVNTQLTSLLKLERLA